MAAVAKKDKETAKQYNYAWTGKDKSGKVVKGETRAGGESTVAASLRRQGIQVQSIKKVSQRGGKKITEKDITIFTRQLAVMMKAGVPLLQAFDIVGRGHSNPSVGKLLLDIKTDVETGSSLAQAFRKYPIYFDALFCNLVAAGRAGRHSRDAPRPPGDVQGKDHRHQGQDQERALLPDLDHRGGAGRDAVIMIFVIPVFKDLFKGFGADLPGPDARRDGDLRLDARQLVVALPGRRLRHLVLLLHRGSAPPRCSGSWTGSR
jgi:type IV pilus assembly protein PilC